MNFKEFINEEEDKELTYNSESQIISFFEQFIEIFKRSASQNVDWDKTDESLNFYFGEIAFKLGGIFYKGIRDIVYSYFNSNQKNKITKYFNTFIDNFKKGFNSEMMQN